MIIEMKQKQKESHCAQGCSFMTQKKTVSLYSLYFKFWVGADVSERAECTG